MKTERPADELNFRELLERLRKTLDEQDREIKRKPSLQQGAASSWRPSDVTAANSSTNQE